MSKEFYATVYAVVLAAVFGIAAFWPDEAEVYLFPRILAILIAGLAFVQCLSLLQHTDRAAASTNAARGPYIAWRVLMPGLIMSVLFVLSLETIGFYVGALLVFLGIVLVYGQRRVLDGGAFLFKLGVGLVFMALLYGLFWKLLYVRTPTGWFI